MDSIVTHAYDALPTAIGVGALLLLLLLLAVKEVLRAAGGGTRIATSMRMLTVALVPLFLLYLCIIAARFLYLLHNV